MKLNSYDYGKNPSRNQTMVTYEIFCYQYGIFSSEKIVFKLMKFVNYLDKIHICINTLNQKYCDEVSLYPNVPLYTPISNIFASTFTLTKTQLM